MLEKRDAGTALGAAIGALLAARPAVAAPENEKVGYLIELQMAMVQQLQRLVEIGEQLLGYFPIVIEPTIVPGLISIPLEPKSLNHTIQAMALHGSSFFPTIRVTWVCPAGTITDFPLPIPEGFVATCTDYGLSSDFYDPNITVNIYVDDRLLTPFGIALTGPQDMEYAEYYIKHKEVFVQTINNTATDAQLSFDVFACFLEKSFYEEFYAPLIQYAYSALQGVARG